MSSAAEVLQAHVATPMGKGVITKVMPPNYLVSLQEGLVGVSLRIPQDKVTFLDRPPPSPAPPPKIVEAEPEPRKQAIPPAVSRPAAPRPKYSVDRMRTIEALRFGLVPTAGLKDLTLGYDELSSWIEERLPEKKGPCKVSEIYGPFGTGKSHTMAAIRHIAQQKGYAVAHVEVDGWNVSLSQPHTLIAQLWSNLRGRNLSASTPMLDMHLKAVERGNRSYEIGHNHVERARDNYRIVEVLSKSDVIDLLVDELESVLSCSGEYTASQAMDRARNHCGYYFDTTLKSVIGRYVDDRPRDFVSNMVSTSIVASLAGYSGLVITVDEFEVEYFLSWKMRERVRALINALCDYLRGKPKFPPAPLALFFATIGEEDHQGDEFVDRLIEAGDGDLYELRPWSKRKRRSLAEKLHSFYCEAYSLDRSFDADVVQEVERSLVENADEESGLIRAFIKRYVARLDRLYGPPAT